MTSMQWKALWHLSYRHNKLCLTKFSKTAPLRSNIIVLKWPLEHVDILFEKTKCGHLEISSIMVYPKRSVKES